MSEQSVAARPTGLLRMSVPLRRSVTVPAALLAIWFVCAHAAAIDRHIFPAPEDVLAAPFADPAGEQIWVGLMQSTARLVVGFGLGASAGVAFGFLLGMSRLADRAAGPSFHGLRQIALFAWVPLLTSWFGNGEVAKIAFVALSAFFPVALNTQEGLRTIPVHYLEVTRVLRLSAGRKIRRLLLPGALPAIFVGLQIGLITAWIGTVGAEYAMGLGRGVGSFLSESREQFRMDLVLLGVLVLALVGYAINVACRRASARLVHWQGARS